jgi:hypothetical protein
VEVEVDTLIARWRAAFAAANAALRAAASLLPPAELRDHARRLGAEQAAVGMVLDAMCRARDRRDVRAAT